MCRERGYRAFKLKVAFDLKDDLANVREITAGLKSGEHFMIDANQGWDLATARPAVEAFSAQLPLDWIEEAIPADDPPDHWADHAYPPYRLPMARTVAFRHLMPPSLQDTWE